MLSLGMRRDFIIFVTGILMLALCLIFCKPGKRTKYRFIRLSAGNLLIHLMDGLITFVNTTDLKENGIRLSEYGDLAGKPFLRQI